MPAVAGLSGGTLDLGFDGRVAAFGVLLALATSLLFGLLPALRTSKTDVAESLRDEGRGRSAGRGLALVRKGLAARAAARDARDLRGGRVHRRTAHAGARIRAALGATRGGIVRMVVGESLVSVGVGLGVGLALAVVSMRSIEALLFGVTPVDAPTFVGAAGLLLAAASVAALMPARRAARANPVDVLTRNRG